MLQCTLYPKHDRIIFVVIYYFAAALKSTQRRICLNGPGVRHSVSKPKTEHQQFGEQDGKTDRETDRWTDRQAGSHEDT